MAMLRMNPLAGLFSLVFVGITIYEIKIGMPVNLAYGNLIMAAFLAILFFRYGYPEGQKQYWPDSVSMYLQHCA